MAEPPEFAFADLRGLIGDDGRLAGKAAIAYKIRLSPGGPWANASPSDDRKHLVGAGDERVRAKRVRAKRKNYGDSWGAVGPCVVSEKMPFAEQPTGRAGGIWAVRLAQRDSWVLARLGGDGLLYQMRGTSKESTAGKKIVVERFGQYGRDHGELLLPEDAACADKPNRLLVRHPALEDEWYPAFREDNRWWIDCGTAGRMKVRDRSVGMIGSENATWKNLG